MYSSGILSMYTGVFPNKTNINTLMIHTFVLNNCCAWFVFEMTLGNISVHAITAAQGY